MLSYTEPLKAESSCAPALYVALGPKNLYGCLLAERDVDRVNVRARLDLVVLSLSLRFAKEVFAAVPCGVTIVVACDVGTAVSVIAVVVSFVILGG